MSLSTIRPSVRAAIESVTRNNPRPLTEEELGPLGKFWHLPTLPKGQRYLLNPTNGRVVIARQL